jgi:RNA 2',3'-cyclic 3'-phosphodiesterase
MTRTFISLEMNEALQRRLRGVIQQVALLLPNLRWVDPQSIHLTLAFLGELNQDQLSEAASAVQMAVQAVSAFTYNLTRLDIFGTPQQPRVLWIGIEEPTGSLKLLHSSLQQQLEQRAFAIDRRPFAPHLTLARGKALLQPNEQATIQKLLTGTQEQFTSPQTYLAAHIYIMKSELTPSGAKYTRLHTYPIY